VKKFSAFVTVLLFVAGCAILTTATLWPALDVRTDDLNGDGRPDVWRHFDGHGQVTQVDIDSNFDGRPDVEEYYVRGVLVRRESDRDFNGQADLVEEFDPSTRGQIRAVVDVDYDGIADTLVLFRDGQAVFSTPACRSCGSAAHPVPAAVRSFHGALRPLVDPFESEAALFAHHATPDDPSCVGLSTSGGLPAESAGAPVRLTPSAVVVAADAPPRTPAFLLQRSPRAPPAF
jgi:hypothetical protein